MRYRSNRQYLYPVLRPDADDYGLDSALETSCDPPQYDQDNGILSISVRFNLTEPALTQAVQFQYAKCAAMVYCGTTLYRDRLEATPADPFVAQGRIPVRHLKNDVQVHPVILAVDDFVLSTETAHAEYRNQPVSVERLAPLATDLPWVFDIDSDARPVRSIFRLEEDDSGRLNEGEFDVDPDPGKDYVAIRANNATLGAFNELRKVSNLPTPTVFTTAVVSVLAFVKELGEEGDDENCAWLRCVKAQLRSHNLDIGGPDYPGEHSLILAAQRLLRTPFAIVLEDYSGADDTDG